MAEKADRFHLRFVRSTPALFLLVSLGALIFVVPMLGPVDVGRRRGVAEICVGLLFVAMLLAAALASARHRVSRIAAWVIVSMLVVLWTVELSTGPNFVTLARHTLSLAYVGYVIILILATLFTTERVTADTIAASLCVYFLLAILWAEIYSIMEITNSGSFLVTTSAGADVPLQLGSRGTALAMYYSLVTMTTLGYGDVVPATPTARIFAAMEAATGQIYLTVLVARLVGMHIASASKRPRSENHAPDP